MYPTEEEAIKGITARPLDSDTISIRAALVKHGRAINKPASELTNAERQQAVLNAFIANGKLKEEAEDDRP